MCSRSSLESWRLTVINSATGTRNWSSVRGTVSWHCRTLNDSSITGTSFSAGIVVIKLTKIRQSFETRVDYRKSGWISNHLEQFLNEFSNLLVIESKLLKMLQERQPTGNDVEIKSSNISQYCSVVVSVLSPQHQLQLDAAGCSLLAGPGRSVSTGGYSGVEIQSWTPRNWGGRIVGTKIIGHDLIDRFIPSLM